MTAQPASAADVEHDIPVYATPEHAARALGHVARHARNRRRRAPDVEPPRGIDSDAAAVLIAEALGAGGGWLGIEETTRLLCAPTACRRRALHVAGSPHAAGRWAATAGDDVALKAIVPGLLHKRDAGAVRLGLRGANAVARAARELRSSLEADGHAVDGFVVQAMAPPGVEMLVGVVADPAASDPSWPAARAARPSSCWATCRFAWRRWRRSRRPT